jgi:uncharacterized membrane protein YphA (DoxX/SURF4 family)
MPTNVRIAKTLLRLVIIRYPMPKHAVLDDSTSHWTTARCNLRYGLVVLCVLSQLITVVMSWPLWQVRPLNTWNQLIRNTAIGTVTSNVNTLPPAPLMPLFDLPQVPFEWLMVGTLGLVLIRPCWGVPLHTAVLLISFVFDQYRTQPQFLANVALLWGCAYLPALPVVRWVLVSLWLWAGLHKFLSPDWMGYGSWHSLNEISFYPDELYFYFAIFVAASEMLLGILAILKPRWAAYYCVALHVGIAVYLCPWLRDWNESVLPWNLCTAAVGCWILLHSKPGWPENRPLQFAAAALLLYPAGFYAGWVDHGIAHVLYSDNHAIALMTSREPRDTSNDPPPSEQLIPLPDWIDRGQQISGFGDLRVPFPNERRLHLSYFSQVAKPGEKLHIHDPRSWGGDEYFLMQADGKVQPIDAARFFSTTETEVGGVALESTRTSFALQRAGVYRASRDARSPIFAIRYLPENYRPQLLESLAHLANVEEIQLRDCAVTDADLQRLPLLYKLRGIGLQGTKVTFQGLKQLLKYPQLETIQFGNGSLTIENLRAMSAQPE